MFLLQAHQVKGLLRASEQELMRKSDEVEELVPRLYEVTAKLRNSETALRQSERNLKARSRQLEKASAALKELHDQLQAAGIPA